MPWDGTLLMHSSSIEGIMPCVEAKKEVHCTPAFHTSQQIEFGPGALSSHVTTMCQPQQLRHHDAGGF